MDRQMIPQRKAHPAAPARTLAQVTIISSSHMLGSRPHLEARPRAMLAVQGLGDSGGASFFHFQGKPWIQGLGMSIPPPGAGPKQPGVPSAPRLPHFPQFLFPACALAAQNPHLGCGLAWNPLAPTSASPTLPTLQACSAPPVSPALGQPYLSPHNPRARW